MFRVDCSIKQKSLSNRDHNRETLKTIITKRSLLWPSGRQAQGENTSDLRLDRRENYL